MVRGVLLDLDGTLVASNDAHAHAWKEAFQQYGYEIPFDKIRPLIGMGADKLLPSLIENLEEDTALGKQITAARRKIFLETYVSSLQPTPGARELIKQLKKLTFNLIVATSANQEELEALLKAANVNDLLDLFTTASDVKNSKPAPDIVSVALKKLSLPAEETIMLGDTPYDIEAAIKCHVPMIAFLCGGFAKETLQDALMIFNDPLDLLNHFEKTPFV